MFHLLYSVVFTTIHKHPFFMTPSCRIVFCLLAHISLIQYSRSLKVLAFRRTLTHIFYWYPCIRSAWTQWVKNNNRPIYSLELKRVVARPSSHYSNYPWSFIVFMGNLVAHDVMASLNYLFYLYIIIFINLKDICVYVM